MDKDGKYFAIPEATKSSISDHNNRSTKIKYNLREL